MLLLLLLIAREAHADETHRERFRARAGFGVSERKLRYDSELQEQLS